MQTFSAQLTATALAAPIHSSLHCIPVRCGDQVRPVTAPTARPAAPAKAPAKNSGPSGNSLTAFEKSPCPFFYLTGHPCPFCGGTRSFAYMWQGDLADSVRLFPLGPAFFAGTFVGVAGLAAGAVSGRTWTPRLTRVQWRVLALGAGCAIAMSWA